MQEDAELARLVAQTSGQLTCTEWARIGEAIGKNAKQARERWSNVLDPSLVKLRNKWTDEELELLFEAQRMMGSKWSLIASTFFKGRCVSLRASRARGRFLAFMATCRFARLRALSRFPRPRSQSYVWLWVFCAPSGQRTP